MDINNDFSNTNNNYKARLSIEEFLSMNEQWIQREAYLKKKKADRMTKLSIWVVVVCIIPFLLIPIIQKIIFLDFGTTMILSIIVPMAVFIVVAMRGVSEEHKDEAESDRIKKELYSQYLKENGFL